MKRFSAILPLSVGLILLFSGCMTKNLLTAPYEYLRYQREGGGQVDFRVYPGESRSNVLVYVSTCDFIQVDKRLTIPINEDNADAIDEFYEALSGSIPVSGQKVKARGLTGTWLNLRFYKGNRDIEISNPELLERFRTFEDEIKNTIKE